MSMAKAGHMPTAKLREALKGLPAADKTLLRAFFALALASLSVGGFLALLMALKVSGVVPFKALTVFQAMTGHAATIFYYWLYFVQAGVILAILLAYTEGAKLTPFWRGIAWLGLALMTIGWLVDLEAVFVEGAAVTYRVDMPMSIFFEGATTFLTGYILLALGLLLVGATGVGIGLRSKVEGHVREWSSVTYLGFFWMAFLMVASVISLYAYLPAVQMLLGIPPIFPNFNYFMSWSVLFHNLHYLPLMSTVLVWYVLAEATTGVKSIYSERFSKFLFSFYLVFVPPTSVYHLFLEPGVAPTTKVFGSVMALFLNVPTIAVFLLVVSSIQSCANGRGARGIFGWLKYMPWKNPAFVTVFMSWIAAFAGGVFANVLLNEQLAPLLSDTFAVPGYFHFLTIAITLTFLAALMYMVPAVTGHRLYMPNLSTLAPVLFVIGVYIFGMSGILAGFFGAPRRTLDFSYGGLSPSIWGITSLIGLGGVVMVAAGIMMVIVIATTLLKDSSKGISIDEMETVDLSPDEGRGQVATFPWFFISLMIVGMALGNAWAYQLMRSLPVTVG